MNESKGPRPNASVPVKSPGKGSVASSPAIAQTGGQSRGRFRLHPVSGLLIILIDTLFFGANAASLGWATPIICLLAFMVTSFGVFLSQKFLSADRFGASLAKGFFSGVLAGIPTSITGTIFGTFVLVSSGLSSLGRKKLKG